MFYYPLSTIIVQSRLVHTKHLMNKQETVEAIFWPHAV